jgi:hypothetical protein
MDRIPPAAAPPQLDPDDYYIEGVNVVFTAQYHLKRGSCCGSGCLHCPYGVEETGALADAGEETPTAG